jgi:thiol-disulfide isomerase/thioredoxin
MAGVAAMAADGPRKKEEQKGPPPAFDAKAFIAKFDRDGDGNLSRPEVPDWMRSHFEKIDSDGDGQLSIKEIDRVAEHLVGREQAPAPKADAAAGHGVDTPPAHGERHPDRLRVGDVAPDFTLPTPDGKQELTLSKLVQAKRPVVLVFCSYTCPPFRGHAPAVERLHRDFGDRASFLLVYIREAHPGSRLPTTRPSDADRPETRIFEQTVDLRSRGEHATICRDVLGFTFPVAVDQADNEVNRAYAGWPIRLVVVGSDGRVAHPGAPGPAGFRPDIVRTWLERNTQKGQAEGAAER